MKKTIDQDELQYLLAKADYSLADAKAGDYPDCECEDFKEQVKDCHCNRVCEWGQDEVTFYQTSCNNKTLQNPEKYCQFCGGKIEVVKL